MVLFLDGLISFADVMKIIKGVARSSTRALFLTVSRQLALPYEKWSHLNLKHFPHHPFTSVYHIRVLLYSPRPV